MAARTPVAPLDAVASDRRGLRRQRVLLGGVITDLNGDETSDCIIRDLTTRGAQIDGAKTLPVGAQIYLLDTRNGAAFLSSVVWADGTRMGLSFIRSYALRWALPPALAFLGRVLLESKLRQINALIAKGIPVEQAITTVGLSEEHLDELAEDIGADEKFELLVRHAKRLLNK